MERKIISKHLLLTTLIVLTSFNSAMASGSKKPTITPETENLINDPIEVEKPLPDPKPDPKPTPTPPPTSSTIDPFNRPWQNPETSIVIDAYEGNSIDWNKMASDPRVVGVIHRSSIGTRIDKEYVNRKKIALERGYLWGAYHLGYRGNTIAQADLFLSLLKDDTDTLMVLDLEDASNQQFMTLNEAVVFMNHIYEKTGKIPTVYANHSTTIQLNNAVKNNPLFNQSKLWYARFKSSINDYPAGIWDNYFLWQFSSEINCTTTGQCLYNVPGTKFDMDVNVYSGNESALRAQWNND